MSTYFLIESRSPFDSVEVNHNYQLASDLAKAGNTVTLFLVENAVLAARKTAQIEGLSQLNQVSLLADDFSLQERGIQSEELTPNVQVQTINAVVEAMANGYKTIWL